MRKPAYSIVSIFLIVIFLVQPVISLAAGSSDNNVAQQKKANRLGDSDESLGNALPLDDFSPISPSPSTPLFTVIFYDWNGATLSEEKVREGEAALPPENPTREGYRFVGWDRDINAIVSDMVVRAQYEALESFTITINYLADNTMLHGPYVATVASGNAFEATIHSPVIPGYQPDYESITIQETSVTKNLEYVVTYTPAQNTPYTVEHHLQSLAGNDYLIDINSTESLEGQTGQSVTATAKSFTGFTAPVSLPTGRIAADGSTVLKVYYKRNLSTLYFDSAGGSYVAPISNLFDSPVVAPTPPTRLGYNFTGWSTTPPTKIPATDQTFTATWTPKGAVNYSVVHWLERPDSSGYDFVGSEQKTGTAGDSIPTPTSPPSAIPFPIASSYFTLDTAKTNTSKPPSIAGDGTTVFNVYYTRNVYTLSFYFDAANYSLTVDGTTYNTSPYQFSAKLGADISKLWPSAEPQLRPGKTGSGSFVGWSGGNSNYVTRQLNLQTNHISDKNLTATWSKTTQSVVVHYWFANLSGTGFTENYTQTLNVSVNSTQFNAKIFPGFIVRQSPLPTSQNIHFIYDRIKYSITFYNGGSIDKVVSDLPYQSSISNRNYTPPRPSNVGTNYTFAGWYTTPQGYDNSKFDFTNATIPDANLVLYARWDKPVYTVSFEADNGLENPPAQKVSLQNTATAPPEPTKAGYLFDGWYLPGATLRYIFNYPVVDNLLLTARWIPNENISYTVNYILPEESFTETYSGKKVGDVVTVIAKNFPGYLPDKVSKSLTMAPSDNIITFSYTLASTPIKYTVRYLYQESGAPALTQETKSTSNNQVVVDYKPVAGYYPDYFQKTLLISQSEKDNIVTFYYSKNPDVNYTVHHYQETIAGTYVLMESESLKTGAGTLVTPVKKTYDNFIFKDSVSSSAKVIASNGTTVFNYYYDRTLAKIDFKAEGSGSLQGTTEFNQIRYGTPFESVVTIPHVTSMPGYTYTWEPVLPESNAPITSSVTYTANFIKDPSLWTTILYDKNNENAEGTMVESESLLIESDYTLSPNAYTFLNHTFIGWNTQPDGSGTAYSDGEIVTVMKPLMGESITLYAQWNKEEEFSVIYYPNGGTGSLVDDNTYFSGNSATIKDISIDNEITFPGYTFLHWNTSADGTGKIFSPNTTVPITENLHLYAIWEYNAKAWSKITFERGDSSATGTMPSVNVLKNIPYPLPENLFIRDNFSFKEWSTDLNGGTYLPRDSYTPVDDTVTFTAQWKEHEKYNITFYPNYPDVTDPNAIKFFLGSFYLGEVFTLKCSKLCSYTNYTLVEWNTLPDGTGQSYVPKTSALTPPNHLDLYGIWEENPNFRVFYQDSLTGGIVTDPIVYYINENVSDTVTVLDSNFSNPGYTFFAWDLYQENILKVSNVPPRAIIGELTQDTVFRTVWRTIPYHLTYDLASGTLAVDNPSTYTIESETFTLVNPSKPGYIFEGWQEATEPPSLTVTLTQGSMEDRHFTAVWKKDEAQWSSIIYSSYDETQGSLSGELRYEGVVGESTHDVAPPQPVPKRGYEFSHWENQLPTLYPAENQKIIAHWRRKESEWIKISYASSDSVKGALYGKVNFEGIIDQPTDNITIPEPLAEKGYAFSGWSIDLPQTYTENLTVYANWKKVATDWSTITFDPGNPTMGTLSGRLSYSGLIGTPTEIVLPNANAKEGYTFTGWSYNVPIAYPEKSLVITAQWEKDTSAWSTITFDPGDTTMGFLTGVTMYEGLKGSITDNIVNFPNYTAVAGYRFSSWSQEIPLVFPEENEVITAFWNFDSSKWSTIQFGISNPLLGTLTGTTSYKGVIGTSVSLAFPKVTPAPGYHLIGWSEKLPTSYPSIDKIIIATLEKNPSQWSKIRFVTDSSKGTLAGTSLYEGVVGMPTSSIGVPVPTPAPGYEFAGWDTTIPEIYPRSSVEIHAVWSKKVQNTTITFVNGNPTKGTLRGTLVYSGAPGAATSQVVIPKTIPNKGYRFDGWSTATPDAFPDSDLVIIGQWASIGFSETGTDSEPETPDTSPNTPSTPPPTPEQGHTPSIRPQEPAKPPIVAAPPKTSSAIPSSAEANDGSKTIIKGSDTQEKDSTQESKGTEPSEPIVIPEEPSPPDRPKEVPSTATEGFFVPLNLIITLLSIVMLILSFVSQVRLKILGIVNRKKTARGLLALSMIVSIGLVVLYIVTVTFGPTLILYDEWTLWLLLSFVVQLLLFGAVFSKKFKAKDLSK